MDVIRESYEQGLSVEATARAIRQSVRRVAESRARLIAQTELAGAVNGAAHAAAQTVAHHAKLTLYKTWLTSPGARRPRHEGYFGLNDQTVRLNETFTVGSSQLEYPGDPSGPIHEIARCRCSIVFEERRSRRSTTASSATGGPGVPDAADPAPIAAASLTDSFPGTSAGSLAAAAADWIPPAAEEVLPIDCEVNAAESVSRAVVTPPEKPLLVEEAAFAVPEGLDLLPPYARTPIKSLTTNAARKELQRLSRYNRSLAARWAAYERGERGLPGLDVMEKLSAVEQRMKELRAVIAAVRKPPTQIKTRSRIARKAEPPPEAPSGSRYVAARTYDDDRYWMVYDLLENKWVGTKRYRRWRVAQEDVDDLNKDAIDVELPRPKAGERRFVARTEQGNTYVVHAKSERGAKTRVQNRTEETVTSVREVYAPRTRAERRLPEPLHKPEPLPPRAVDPNRQVKGTASTRQRDEYSYKARVRRLQEAHDKAYQRKWARSPLGRMDSATSADVDEVMDVGRVFADVVNDRIRRAAASMPKAAWTPDVRARIIQETLAEVRELGEGLWVRGETLVFKEESMTSFRSVQEAAEFLPRDWIVEADMQHNALATTTASRGSWKGSDSLITLPDAESERVRVALHELAHLMEERVPYLRAIERAYYKRRTEGETLTPLAKLKPNNGYGLNEMTRPNHLRDPYMGKDYETGANYELLSMGIEDIFFRRGARQFAFLGDKTVYPSESIWDTDPEYRNFILGLLVLV